MEILSGRKLGTAKLLVFRKQNTTEQKVIITNTIIFVIKLKELLSLECLNKGTNNQTKANRGMMSLAWSEVVFKARVN